jgi:hypothetical protein
MHAHTIASIFCDIVKNFLMRLFGIMSAMQ